MSKYWSQSSKKLDTILSRYDFTKIGEIVRDKEKTKAKGKQWLKFISYSKELKDLCKEEGVYITVDDNDFQDFYFGSAMNGWLKRWNNYSSGMRNKSAGKTNVEAAKRFWSQGKVFVYYYIPAEVVYGPTGETMKVTQSFENKIIKEFFPTYNKSKNR
jgi:hypothetical protein|tara:strand:+ start:13 stop:486 length:474 start_codon:yes stop_codon:yes gene_type:complete